MMWLFLIVVAFALACVAAIVCCVVTDRNELASMQRTIEQLRNLGVEHARDAGSVAEQQVHRVLNALDQTLAAMRDQAADARTERETLYMALLARDGGLAATTAYRAATEGQRRPAAGERPRPPLDMAPFVNDDGEVVMPVGAGVD